MGDSKYLLVLTAELVSDWEDNLFPAARFEGARGLGMTFLSIFSSLSLMSSPGKTDWKMFWSLCAWLKTRQYKTEVQPP